MTEQSPRDAIGLTAAHEGDLRELRRFVDFVHRELWSLSSHIMSGLPESVGRRIGVLSREADSAVKFLDGYIAAEEQRKKTS